MVTEGMLMVDGAELGAAIACTTARPMSAAANGRITRKKTGVILSVTRMSHSGFNERCDCIYAKPAPKTLKKRNGYK